MLPSGEVSIGEEMLQLNTNQVWVLDRLGGLLFPQRGFRIPQSSGGVLGFYSLFEWLAPGFFVFIVCGFPR